MFGTILLIDDDNATNYLHKYYLEEWGICERVMSAEDGQIALGLIKDNPDIFSAPNSLILLDINMPVMNGFEFLQEYEKMCPDKKANWLFVMLTTELSEGYQQRANAISDIDGFVGKPLAREELIQQVRINSKISLA